MSNPVLLPSSALLELPVQDHVLRGREAHVAAFVEVQRRLGTGSPGALVVIEGARGMGRTAVLEAAAVELATGSWWVASERLWEAEKDLSIALVNALTSAVRSVAGRWPGASATHQLKALVVSYARSVGQPAPFDTEPMTGIATTGDLRDDTTQVLRGIGSVLRDLDAGFALLFDDVDWAREAQRNAILLAAATVLNAGWPILVGVTLLPGRRPEVPAITRVLGPLPDEVIKSIVATVGLDEGAIWDPAAMSAIAIVAGGNPLLSQVYASEALRLAPGGRVSPQAVVVAQPEAEAVLATRLLRPTALQALKALPGPQRRVLTGVGDLGGRAISMADLAVHLGERVAFGGVNPALAQVCATLVDVGLLVQQDGKVGYPFPFIARLVDRLR